MSQYDDRHEAVKAQLSETQKGLAALPDERRQDIQDELARLEDALGFGAVVLAKADPELVPDGVHAELTGALTQINDQVTAANTEPGPVTESLLNAIARLPAAKGQITAQKLKGTVADFRRDLSQQLDALRTQIGTARQEAKRPKADRPESAGPQAVVCVFTGEGGPGDYVPNRPSPLAK